ncbi:MAG: AsmA-like C-terminal domain-containing protein [Desulfuromonadaceae bacterium]|nr:AsmA-like C-terminal domain-containing protein [Desulfuromonadaceae bacterium]
MIIKARFIKLSGILLLSVATLLIGVAFFLPRLLDVNAYRDEILEAVQKSLNRPVSFSSGSFAWDFGPSFVFKTVLVKERDGSANFLSADKISVRISLLPLLEKKVELKYLHLYGAKISLVRNADKTLNIDDLLKPEKGSIHVQFKRIIIKNGTVQWFDLAQQKNGVTATLSNLSLVSDLIAPGRKGTFKLSCDVPAATGPPAHISLSGQGRLPAADNSLLDTELNFNADLKQLEIGKFWPYYGRFIPFANSGGRVDFSTSFKGKLQDFAAKCKIRINGATVNWPAIFHATLSPRSLQLDFSIKLTKQLIDISSLEAGFEGFRVKGSFQMHDYATKDPRIIAKAFTPDTFRYEDVKYYVPYGIIEKDTSDYIEHKIKTGVFKLDTGILDGHVSQIAHMEIGQNQNILSISGPVEKAVLSYGPKAPTFNNIKGTIELKGKNFNLIGMSGNFGTSPFKLNGSITEYNTDKQSDYPVRMEITPNGPEVAWLAKIAGADKLDYGNSSKLILTGNGHYSAYRLNGEWDLKQAFYLFPGAIRKPIGMPNHLLFSSVIGREDIRLTSLAYTLPPLMISATAQLKYGRQPFLDFELQSNPFQLNDSLPILSLWQQYRPRGKIQAHIKGSGNPDNFSAMDYNGNILLNGFSFQPAEKIKPVSGINGTITFKGNSLETSRITAQYGSSLVTLKANVKSLKNPEAEVTLSSPEFYIRDVAANPSRYDASIRRFNAVFSIREGVYTFRSISGLLNSSDFNISGTYLTGLSKEATFIITSNRLDLDDLKLFKPFTTLGDDNAGKGIATKIMLNIEAGNYRKLQFSKLNAILQHEDGVFHLQRVSAGIFDGQLSAKGGIASDGGEGDRYDLSLDLLGADAEKLFAALDISREVTGSLTLHGNITARGETLLDIKKSAKGNVNLHMNKGKLRKFNTLSKVFSILNVSQLLKFHLPDMVSGGMPYNNIKGNFSIKEGVLASQDLFINSDAINISVVGSADIVKEELNFTLGVQPLQTVDKIVNRIPVVGWLLTGKERDFLTAYFEAKGKWSDPKVSAIPVKSVGKGIFNIFRRVFELPVKLFTDTGEVILGQ